jgi:peptidoglycan/xylan/chitin deacetylase (PgdA/CDA1 family)
MSILIKLKHFVSIIFYYFGIINLLNRCIKLWYGNKATLVILCYHSITKDEVSLFEWQLDYISKRGFKVISGSKLSALLKTPRDFDGKDRFVCLTFDDCYLNNYTIVREILRRRNLDAIFFASTRNMGKETNLSQNTSGKEIMSSSHIKIMAEDFEIGAHTQHHVRLAGVAESVAEMEILGSKKDLMDMLGKDVLFFAYPNGSYSNNTIRIVQMGKYLAAFTIEQHTNYCYTERYKLGRYLIKPSDKSSFRLKVDGGYDWFFFLQKATRILIKSSKSIFRSDK